MDFMARLKQLVSGGALHQKVLSKTTDILLQAGKEIDGIANVFRENQVSKNHVNCEVSLEVPGNLVRHTA